MLRTLHQKRTSTSSISSTATDSRTSKLDRYGSSVGTEDMELPPFGSLPSSHTRKTSLSTMAKHSDSKKKTQDKPIPTRPDDLKVGSIPTDGFHYKDQRKQVFQQHQQQEEDLNDLRYSASLPTSNALLKNMQRKITKESSIKPYDASKIVVCVRKRPLSKKEKLKSDPDAIKAVDNTVHVFEPKLKVDLTKYTEVHPFTFDVAFDENAKNQDVYNSCAKPLVQAFFEGSKVTCFAYGQTGAGKTHTMMGTPEEPGLYTLALQDIFQMKQKKEYAHLGVYISFFEIYGSKLFDLLNGKKRVECREDAKQRVRIIGLEERLCEDPNQVAKTIEEGGKCRSTGSTGANADSSRSHAILEIQLKYMDAQTENPSESDPSSVYGKLSFIDLAGSERAADTTHSDRQTRMEGAEINKSLLALKECIRALGQNQYHTPFRGSKLTLVLKDSFISADSRTVMIANVSPAASNCEHTLNTLRYADRVKELRKDSPSHRRASSTASFASMDTRTTEVMDPIPEDKGKKVTRSGSNETQESTDFDIFQEEMERDEQDKSERQQQQQQQQEEEEEEEAKTSFRSTRSRIPPPAPSTSYTSRSSKLASSLASSYTTMDSVRSLRESKRVVTDSSSKTAKETKLSSIFSTDSKSNEKEKTTTSSRSTRPTRTNDKTIEKETPIGSAKFGFLSSRMKPGTTPTTSTLGSSLSTKNQVRPSTTPSKKHLEKGLSNSFMMDEDNSNLQGEEAILSAHRQHIDEIMELVKHEMSLLKAAERPDAPFEEYLERLERYLERKLSTIRKLRDKIFDYRNTI
ncbi:Kinesin-like protein KIF2C [Galdieria sulphuraria]|uniref:Kinesin-like protein n=1 Tax=Galdieria sulphuraria TaxID=130081 RepID=M2Y1Z0_GALSU|nr:kinesin family member [Galdieria sulphuraria]EME29829.1 kinesin family member [Galdieria sulphuraria]GJD06817.1 Kinesin-like protein KIF2C [Galdieria sulphuraria]|eukprot:XP_005706349.1 kinesin family member [Galdieria sulphuraria]